MAMVRAAGVLGRALTLAWLAGASILSAQGLRNLEPGASVERLLAPGETHEYQILLSSGQFFRLVVEQNHVDLVVRILSAEKALLGAVENAADRAEPLSLSVLVTRGGVHRVEIGLRSRTSRPGSYRLVVGPLRAASADDDERIAAERYRAEADLLLGRGSAESSKGALQLYERALIAFREIGDRREEAATLARMSDALAWQGDLGPALERAEQALALWRAEGDRYGEAAALDQVGLGHAELGDQRLGLEFLEQALVLRRADDNRLGQAETLNNIAVARQSLGQHAEAIALLTEALELDRAAGHRLTEAIDLKNRATSRVALGETDRALADFRSALASFRAAGNRREQGITQYEIGNVLLRRGEATPALRQYGLARAVLQEVGDKFFEAFTLNQTGLARLAVHTPRRALADFQLALELFRASQDRRGEAMVLGNIGRAHLEMGETAEGLNRLRQALPLVQDTGDRFLEAIALEDLARGERAQGNLAAARDRVEEALRITESVRESIPAEGMRASFTAVTRDRYDLLIDTLMDLHAKQPGEGWDAEALHACERARARSLIELLAEAHIDLREGVDESLLEKERSLDARLETRRREEQRRLAGASGTESSDSSRGALDALLSEYEDVQGRLRAASPRYAALSRPQPFGLKEIREQVLDRETLLLEFELGKRAELRLGRDERHAHQPRAAEESGHRGRGPPALPGMERRERHRRGGGGPAGARPEPDAARTRGRSARREATGHRGRRSASVRPVRSVTLAPRWLDGGSADRHARSREPAVRDNPCRPAAGGLRPERAGVAGGRAGGSRLRPPGSPRPRWKRVERRRSPRWSTTRSPVPCRKQGCGDSRASAPAGARPRRSPRSPGPERASSPWTSWPAGRWRWARTCRARASSISRLTVS